MTTQGLRGAFAAGLLVCSIYAAAQGSSQANPAQAAPAAGVVTVEVFVNSAMHVTPEPSERTALPYTLSVYRLDALRNMEAQINQNLPQTEAEAMRWVAANEARLRRKFQPQIQAAAEGVTLAASYRLQRIPAVVINRKVVVYGVTDANQAIELVRRRKAGGRS